MNLFLFAILFGFFCYLVILFLLREKLPNIYMLLKSELIEYIFIYVDKLIGIDSKGKFNKVIVQKEIHTEYIVKEKVVTVYESLEEKSLHSNNKLSTKEKGRLFEEYVVSLIDFENDFTFKEWRGDKYINGKYPDSNTYPDLLISYDNLQGRKPFVISVECKYRSEFYNGYLNIGKDQLKNYRKFAKNERQKVSVMLGVGGHPSNPNNLYLIPLPIFEIDGSIKKSVANKYLKAKGKLKFDVDNLNIS